MQQSVLVITVDSRQAERNVKQLDKELIALTNQGDKTGRSLGGVFSELTTYAAGFLTVATAINKIDMFTNLQNRLKLVTSNQQELNTAMGDTFRIAQQTYSAWDGVVQVYQRFSDNAKALNIDMQQTAQLTETVSKAVAISGASAASAEAALTQFGQSLASGVFRGEEFNSVAEQTPALLKAIAQGLGVTIGELRSMAQNGEITSDVLVKALTNARASVDNLFSKVDITIAQSVTLLSNEVTKFIGEAGRGSGAATTLAGSIKLLAENISLIADVALAAGIGYITKAIITKTVAVEADIAASIASRNASVAVAQAELAEATAATNAAKAHLANTQATLAATQAKYGATAASVRYTTAQAALTAATNAQAAAQARLTAATALFSRVGGAALALVGGAIGVLALAIGGAAFAFSALSKRSEEANQKLLETSRYAKLSAEELNNLEGTQKRAAKDELVKSFDEKNKRLKELSYQFNATVIDMQNYAKGNVEVAKISNDVRQGIISQEEAIKRLNKLDLFTGDQIQSAEDANQKYREQLKAVNEDEKALQIFGVTVKLAGNAAENAAFKVDSNTNALNDNANAADKANKAQQDYIKTLRQNAIQTGITNELISRGYDPERAKQLTEAYVKSGNTINAETVKLVDQNIAENKKLQASIESVSNARKSSNTAARGAARQEARDAKEASRLAEEQFKAREDIKYKYATRETQIEMDLQEELKRIREARFSSKDEQGFISNAKNRADLQKELYSEQLAAELNEWQDTEQEKLDRKVKINSILIKLDSSMNDEIKQQALASLIDRSAFEADQLDLNKRKRIFDAEEFQYSEIERIKKRYELEREEINKTADLEERNALLQASLAKQNQEESNVRDQAISDYRGVMGFEESPLVQQFKVLDKMRELDLINEQAYQEAKLQLQAKYTASYMEGMLGGFASLVDENSKTYAVLFAAQKAFAVAQAVLNIPQAYSKAYDAVVGTPYIGPYIAPAVGAAAAALQVAQAAKVKSVSMQGFESGGYTGNMGTKTVAGVVHGQEYVMNAKATKSIGVNNLETLSKTGELPNQQAQPVTNIINVFDESELRAAMATPAGEKIFINTVKRNKTAFRAALGV